MVVLCSIVFVPWSFPPCFLLVRSATYAQFVAVGRSRAEEAAGWYALLPVLQQFVSVVVCLDTVPESAKELPKYFFSGPQGSLSGPKV